MKNGTAATATRERELLDLYQSAFHLAKTNHPNLIVKGDRVIFVFQDNDLFRQNERAYLNNELIGCLDLATSIRRLRSEMLSLRDSGGRR